MKMYFTSVVLAFTFLAADAQIFVNKTALGNNDGTSWSNAFVDLQDAINAASPGAQIWIAAGTYVPDGPTPDSSHFVALKPLEFYGGFAGTESSLSERDWEQNVTILSGDINGDDVPYDFVNLRTDNAHHILIINAPNTTSVVDGLVFQGGTTKLDNITSPPTAADIPYNRWNGGALYLYQSGGVIRNCLFHDNNSGARGSGCYAFGDTLLTISLQFDNVTFRDNNGYNGAAGFFHAYQDLHFKNCHFFNNVGFQGGAAFFSGTNAIVEDCVFESNTSTFGGAINCFHGTVYLKYLTTRIARCSFTGNSATSRGGGIYYNNTSGGFSFQVDSCMFRENETSENGSGGGIIVWDVTDAISNERTSQINISNSEFKDNTSGYGGGVEIETADDSINVQVLNNLFNKNTGYSGAGFYFWMAADAKAALAIRSNDFTENVSSLGGGLSVETSENTNQLHYLIDDCLFTDNTADIAGGAVFGASYPPGLVTGTITNNSLTGNSAIGTGGAMYSYQQNLLIEDSYFLGNHTDASLDSAYHGGGAITTEGPAEVSLNRNIFEDNISSTDGAAIATLENVDMSIENSLFHHHEGNSTIFNDGFLRLVNTTLVENANGLLLQNASSTEIKNSIFNNQGDNLRWVGKPSVISNGGNLSSDTSMISFLTGSGSYQDFNDTDPLLGVDYYPLSGSPCIDAGNPQGIKFPFDLGGNPRVQGGGIDIGSYESFLVATQDAQWNTSSFTVYPNPVNDMLHFILETEAIGDINLTLYSFTGQVVHRARLNKTDYKQSFSEDLQLLAAGEYVVVLTMAGRTYARNIVVQP